MYGIVRSMVKVIESGRNDLTPQTSNQRRGRNLSNEFKSDLEKQEHVILWKKDKFVW